MTNEQKIDLSSVTAEELAQPQGTQATRQRRWNWR